MPPDSRSTSSFDVLVIGGGHAGIEAAHAAARMGRRTALLTGSVAAIGRMSCNPAIGGLAKGQLVREIDALGGLMGELADAAGIQFRILNRSRGPAVWGPRAQCDRALYARLAGETLAATENLTILEGMAEELVEAARPRVRRGHGGGRAHRGRGRRRHGRHLPERPHAHGRAQDRGRPRRRGGGGGPLGRAVAARTEARPLQDRHAAAPAPRHDRLRRLRAAARRRSARALLVPHEASARAPGPVLADGDQRARPRAHPREPAPQPDVLGPDSRRRPALLPVGRGQGRAVRRQGPPHDLPRARRVGLRGDLRQRPLDLAARRRAARDPRRDPRALAGAHDPARLRRRVRLRLSRSAAALARGARGARALSRGADQRHLGLRGGGGAGDPGGDQRGARGCAAKRRSCSSAPRPTRRS